MKPFVFKHADDSWQGGTLLHVYVQVSPERDAELAALVTSAHDVLKDFPVTPVTLPWLHITLDQITGRQAALIPQRERDDLIAALTQRLADVDPFEVLVGSMLSYHSGVIADLHPDEQLTDLHRSVRSTIRTVLGDDAVRYPWSTQHLTFAYAHGEANSDEVQRRLRRVRPS